MSRVTVFVIRGLVEGVQTARFSVASFACSGPLGYFQTQHGTPCVCDLVQYMSHGLDRKVMIRFVIQIAACSPSSACRPGAPSSGFIEKDGVHVFEIPDLVQQLLDRIGLKESMHELYFDTKMAAELGELSGLVDVELPDFELGGEYDEWRRRRHNG
jgi:hypothetical protein